MSARHRRESAEVVNTCDAGTFMKTLEVVFAIGALLTGSAAADQECWALTQMKGQMAFSPEYAFEADAFSKPMVLCFGRETGSVSGDETRLLKFGRSTLAGWSTNNGTELFEVYQIDRANGKVLFTKSRIGTTTVIPGAPDIVGAFTGTATRLK